MCDYLWPGEGAALAPSRELLIVVVSPSAVFPYSYGIMGKISLQEITKARLPVPESCILYALISFVEWGISADSRDLSVWEQET